MKKLPADSVVVEYQYPAYEADHAKSAPHLANIPSVEGFTPFQEGPAASKAENLPLVQNAEFQDFAKVVKPQG